MARWHETRPARAAIPDSSAAQANPLDGLDAEAAALHRIIRELIEQEQIQEARRQIETLCRVLRTRHVLDDRAVDSLSQALARSLEELGRALGEEER